MRLQGLFLLAAGFIGGALTDSASADVFKFVDAKGHVYYTDKPTHSGYRKIIQTPLSFVSSAPRTFRSRVLGANASRKRAEFAPIIAAAADRYSLDPQLLHAVIRAESAYNPGAVSNKGAAGLMQLMPATADRYGVRDRFNPEDNIDGGARYLSDLLNMFQSDVRLAVAAYNSGENTVKRFGNQIPPIPETQDYVTRVLSNYQRY